MTKISNEWVENGKKARELKDSLEIELKSIEKEKRDLVVKFVVKLLKIYSYDKSRNRN